MASAFRDVVDRILHPRRYAFRRMLRTTAGAWKDMTDEEAAEFRASSRRAFERRY